MSEAPMYLSLFSGCGGFDIGFEQEGFELGLAFDIRAPAIASVNTNRDRAVGYVRDIRQLGIEDFDKLYGAPFNPVGVIGGPPCQSFSRGNRSKTDDDPRQSLVGVFFDKVLALHRRQPLEFVVMENVPELRSFENGRILNGQIARLRRAGFSVKLLNLDSQDFSVAQRRRRLFLVGIQRQKISKWAKIEAFCCAKNNVKDVLKTISEPLFFCDSPLRHTVLEHENHWCMTPRSAKFANNSLQPGKSFGRSFKTLDWESVSPTISFGHREVHVHPSGRRRLSVYESMILQGFPKNYILQGNLSDQFSQVSEAVSPPVARAIAKLVIHSLNPGK